MIRYFIENRIAVVVLCLAIMLFGLLALLRLPIQLTPDVSTPKVTVSTYFPGATPQDIEQDILIEQERFLKNIPGLVSMVSTASMGSAEIILEFGLETDEQENLIRVQNALAQVSSYPENVDQPSIQSASADEQPIGWFNIRVLPEFEDQLDIREQLDYADDFIKPEFERIPGVSGVRGVFGASARELQVYLDPVQLSERGLSVFEVRQAIRGRNRDVSGGDLEEGKRRFNVRTLGRYEGPADLEDTVLAWRDGVPIRLRDVGYARLGHAEARSVIRVDGDAALGFGIKHQRGTNMLLVMETVQDKVKELNETLKDRGLYITQATDDTIYVHEAVDMVRANLLLGGALAILVLLIFLRHVRSTLVLAIAIPLSVVGSFFLISAAGRSINVISLAGLAFSIGVVLDSSIVVLENIYRHRTDLQKGPAKAARDGASEVWTAIVSSTLTNVVVFAPIITLHDEAGQLFRDIAIAIIAANVLALVVSIVVIPPLAARLLRTPPTQPKRSMSFRGLFGLVGLAERFHRGPARKGLEWLLGGVGRRVVVVVATLAAAWVFIVVLMPRTEYLPEGNEVSIMGLVIPPQGYGVTELDGIARGIEADLRPLLDAEPGDYEAGRVEAPPLRRLFVGAFGNIMLIFTAPKDYAHAPLVPAHLRKVLGEIPGVITIASQSSIFGGGFTGHRAIELNVTGSDITTLTAVARAAFFKVMQALPGGQARPRPGIEIGQPQVTLTPDWTRATELGLDAQSIGYSAWVMGDGAWADEHYEGGDKMDLYLYSTPSSFDTLAQFEQLRVATPAGDSVALGDVADVEFSYGPQEIRHVDGRRAVTLEIVPPKDMSLEEAIERVATDIIGALHAEGAVPEGYNVRIGGTSDKLAAIRDRLGMDFLLALALAYLCMVLVFRHFGHPITVMLSIPVGLTGGVVGLALLNQYLDVVSPGTIQSLDVLTMLGFVILLGSVINNPILIVQQAQNFRDEGMDAHQAIVEATLTRIRPIFMTTATTIFGLLPLVLNPGAGSELYRGLGVVMFGGLIVGTLSTLVFIPAVMSLTADVGRLFSRSAPLADEAG